MLVTSLLEDGFGYWLAGLVDGEGSFTITPNRPGFVCRLSVSLRADDSEVLRLIAARTGIGKVVMKTTMTSDAFKRRPQAMWRVQKKEDCSVAVSIFDRYPLRAKKAADYLIWREAVAVMSVMQPVHPKYWERRALDWERVAQLKLRLSEARVYRERDLQHVEMEDHARACPCEGSEPLHR